MVIIYPHILTQIVRALIDDRLAKHLSKTIVANSFSCMINFFVSISIFAASRVGKLTQTLFLPDNPIPQKPGPRLIIVYRVEPFLLHKVATVFYFSILVGIVPWYCPRSTKSTSSGICNNLVHLYDDGLSNGFIIRIITFRNDTDFFSFLPLKLILCRLLQKPFWQKSRTLVVTPVAITQSSAFYIEVFFHISST